MNLDVDRTAPRATASTTAPTGGAPVSGTCRYAAAHPAYADFHAECRATFEVTVPGPGGGTVSGQCACPCHADRSREARR